MVHLVWLQLECRECFLTKVNLPKGTENSQNWRPQNKFLPIELIKRHKIVKVVRLWSVMPVQEAKPKPTNHILHLDCAEAPRGLKK